MPIQREISQRLRATPVGVLLRQANGSVCPGRKIDCRWEGDIRHVWHTMRNPAPENGVCSFVGSELNSRKGGEPRPFYCYYNDPLASPPLYNRMANNRGSTDSILTLVVNNNIPQICICVKFLVTRSILHSFPA